MTPVTIDEAWPGFGTVTHPFSVTINPAQLTRGLLR